MHTKPKVFIEDINITTELDENNDGIINYSVDISGLEQLDESFTCQVDLLDSDDKHAINNPQSGLKGTFQIKSPKLWWPRLMVENPGYLYTFKVLKVFTFQCNLEEK